MSRSQYFFSFSESVEKMLVYFLLIVFRFVRLTVNDCHDLSTICIAIVCDRNRRYGFVRVFIPRVFFSMSKNWLQRNGKRRQGLQVKLR